MATNLVNPGAPPGQPWFLGAPLTKVVSMSIVIAFVLIEVKKSHGALAMDVKKIINDGQYYRLVTGHITFGTGGELVMGTGVLTMLLRRFEREMGSRKMASFLTMVGLIGVGLELVLAQVLQIPLLYSGPYPWVGALAWLFYCYTPRMHPRFFGILGFHFSEKSINYAFFFFFLCSGWIMTIFPSVCGMLAAYLCSSPKLPLFKLEFPEFICGILETVGERLVEDPPPIQATHFARPRGRQQPQVHQFVPPPVQRRPSPPPESAVEQLTSMGFDREAVLGALRQTNNNVERAADRLLMGA